jgi:ArsR family transcriptional regulator, arsenate/arsenite/antimonite-responsive transcriptional repressor
VTATNHATVASAAKGKLPILSDTAIKDVAKLFKLLADETRLRILALLTQNDECHVRALCDVLRQSQPAVSHHLALLRVAGLIECRREGKHNFYRAMPERVKVLLDIIFADVPEANRRIRLDDYVLMHSPPAAP